MTPQALPAQVAKMLGEMLNQTEAGLARVLVNQLGASPGELAGYMLKKEGEQIEEGEPLARFDRLLLLDEDLLLLLHGPEPLSGNPH